LNGTSNFVLDRVAAGATIGDAVKDAQAQGFAEANAQLDLDGTDAAQKLLLLAHSAFGVNLPLGSVQRKGIEDLDAKTLRQAEQRGRRVRLVAECRSFENRFEASVGPVELPLDHTLAQVRGANNGLLVEPHVGTAWTVSGRGAGRWPTAEAVLADLLDLKRELQMTETDEVLEECVA
jgi:homoserine dehydrogenase